MLLMFRLELAGGITHDPVGEERKTRTLSNGGKMFFFVLFGEWCICFIAWDQIISQSLSLIGIFVVEVL